ncbi:hypothetical protein FLJU110815_19670 [Flavobacterium jumunjinense]
MAYFIFKYKKIVLANHQAGSLFAVAFFVVTVLKTEDDVMY